VEKEAFGLRSVLTRLSFVENLNFGLRITNGLPQFGLTVVISA